MYSKETFYTALVWAIVGSLTFYLPLFTNGIPAFALRYKSIPAGDRLSLYTNGTLYQTLSCKESADLFSVYQSAWINNTSTMDAYELKMLFNYVEKSVPTYSLKAACQCDVRVDPADNSIFIFDSLGNRKDGEWTYCRTTSLANYTRQGPGVNIMIFVLGGAGGLLIVAPLAWIFILSHNACEQLHTMFQNFRKRKRTNLYSVELIKETFKSNV